jgi:hypothetical protein
MLSDARLGGSSTAAAVAIAISSSSACFASVGSASLKLTLRFGPGREDGGIVAGSEFRRPPSHCIASFSVVGVGRVEIEAPSMVTSKDVVSSTRSREMECRLRAAVALAVKEESSDRIEESELPRDSRRKIGVALSVRRQ